VDDLSGNLLISPAALYVECQKVHGPIAIRLRINEQFKIGSWEDTVRNFSINIKKYQIFEKKVEILDKDDAKWSFIPLTLKLFEKVRAQLSPISIKFLNDADLQNYYLTTDFTN
jgi:hypothetical protein